MFEDAEVTLDRILQLVAKCPPGLQDKCFEILLKAYTDSQQRPLPKRDIGPRPPAPEDDRAPPPPDSTEVPDAIKGRFNTTVARLKVKADKLAGLFDFQQDPFTFHGVAVPGDNKAAKTRNVALLLAFKSYLSTGAWSADWKEFRAMCVDQSCYDRANMASHLSKAGFFKTASAEEGLTLNSSGVSAAEALITQMTGGTPQADAVE